MKLYFIAVHTLVSVESLSLACVNSLGFAKIRFILFISLGDCNNAAPVPKLKASHIGWSGSGIVFDICSMRSVFISPNRFWCSVVHSKLFCCLRML